MGESKLLKDYPEVLKEWDYELNTDVLIPDFLFARSNKKYYWKCPNGHPSYLCSVDKKTVRKFGCPVCSNHQIVAGINDFESRHPELMDEWDWEENNKNGIIPSKLGPVSSCLVSWKCKKCGNVWEAPISNRVRVHSGCPYCANLKVKTGFNDLLTLRPDLAKEWDYEKNGDLTPDKIVAYSSKKVWWKCEKNHSWQSSPDQRVRNGCPYCANKKVLVGYNDFQTLCPNAASEWDYDKNYGRLPSQFTCGSEVKAWFKCSKGHSWIIGIKERSRGHGCPICVNQIIVPGINNLFSTNPELEEEWDYDKNVDISPLNVSAGSDKKAWWKCSKCGMSWQTPIGTRARVHSGCPSCSAKQGAEARLKTMVITNGLADKYPELIDEWDFEKNQDIDLSLVTASSNRYAWWKCKKGHSFRATITSRTTGKHGCPYCANQKVLTGINDLATINPALAEEWDYEKNYPLKPSDIFAHTGKSYWWKCLVCGHSWKSTVNNRSNGRGCPNCNKAGTSLVEQSIYYYLKQVFNDAKNRYRHNNTMELDIFIPSLSTAIEYDGSFFHSIKNSKLREKRKDDYCKENSIKLIRLREKPLDFTEDAINIQCVCTNWTETEKTIAGLFDYLGINEKIDISLKRDLTKIITSKRMLLKEKSIKNLYPHIADEWDYDKNYPLVPEYFSRGSSVKVWWKCPKCGYSWSAAINSRTSGHGCPNCSHKRTARNLKKKNM